MHPTYTDRNGLITVTQQYPATDGTHTADTTVETWFAVGADPNSAPPLRSITTIRDSAGDVISVTDVANQTTTPVTQSTWNAAYDNLGQLSTSSQSFVYGASSSPAQAFSYGYTADGLRKSLTLTVGSSTITTGYGYDNLNRMTSVTQTADGRVLQAG